MAWQEPKTDWPTNPKNPAPEDFNRIEGNIDFLKGDIETKKGAIVDALNTVGLASELTDTHATLASRITGANQGAKIITPGTTNQTIAKGFHSGAGYVKGDANLVSANIKKGVSIFGVVGSFGELQAGDIAILFSDVAASTSSGTYTKVKEIKCYLGGTVKVRFDLDVSGYAGTVYARIYVNSSPVGTERSAYNRTTFFENITINPGDLVQIYAKGIPTNNPPTQAIVSNFRICAAPSSFGTVNL